MTRSVGIVGFGDFGKLLARELSAYSDVLVFDQRKIAKVEHGKVAELNEVLQQDVIIPAIPAQFFEEFFELNKKRINPNALIMDVCSVKVRPQEVLTRVLPKTCEIIATHPMFGPNSTPDGIAGKKIMLYPTRIKTERYEKLKTFITDQLKLKIIECKPDEHDKMMAYVQGLSHYIGRVLQELGIPETELSTRAYDDLYDMRMIQGNDSWELFRSIMHENPYADEVNKAFKSAMQNVDERLRG